MTKHDDHYQDSDQNHNDQDTNDHYQDTNDQNHDDQDHAYLLAGLVKGLSGGDNTDDLSPVGGISTVYCTDAAHRGEVVCVITTAKALDEAGQKVGVILIIVILIIGILIMIIGILIIVILITVLIMIIMFRHCDLVS